MEWHDLEKMTVVKLREEAHEKGIESVHGKNKAELVEALAGVLGIERPHEELAKKEEDTKTSLKQQIRELRAERDQLLEAHDHKGLKDVRREVHRLKRKIRRIHLVAAHGK